MSDSVIRILILKDWRLHRLHVLLSLAAGGIALAVLQMRSETAFMLGTVWFFVSLIVLGSMLPVSNVINERKKQNLAFLMSLPVSALQYAAVKMVSTLGMFLVPWAALVIGGLTFVLSRGDIPNGFIPLMLILAGLPFVGFCVIAGAALISESEGWTIAATVLCNSSYGLVYYFLIRNPAINGDLKSPVAVWSPIVVTILAEEFAAVALILGLTFYLQSRKRDFI
jgi:ABC-2 type transport system permease protein